MSATLAGLQRAFMAAMRGDDSSQSILTELSSAHGIPGAVGMSIYRNAYASRLSETLEKDHPALGTYLGDALWARMCDGYLRAHPSRFRSLRYFGDALPAYLGETAPFSEMPQIAEIAAFERCLLDRFDAADAQSAEWDALSAIPDSYWPELRIQFHTSVYRFEATFNSVEIWSAIKEGAQPPSVAEQPMDWLVWRDRDRVTRFRSMPPDESLAHFAFARGQDFADVCELMMTMHPAEDVPIRAIALLRVWCEEGLVQRWVIDE